jgi:hypothetical protein
LRRCGMPEAHEEELRCEPLKVTVSAMRTVAQCSGAPGRLLSVHVVARSTWLLMLSRRRRHPWSLNVVYIVHLEERDSDLVSAHEIDKEPKVLDANALAIVSFASPSSAWL